MPSLRALGTVLLLSASCVSAIWPIPKSISTGKDLVWGKNFVWISEDVQFKYEGPKGTKGKDSLTAFVEKRINSAIARTKEDLFKYNFVPWKFHPRKTQYEPAINKNGGRKDSIKVVKLKQTAPDPSRKPGIGEIDESYELVLDGAKEVIITAKSSIGILHGLESFKQLFYKHNKVEGAAYTPYSPVKISDKPLLPHRGLNLDVARQWYPVQDIKRTINALSLNKFNRLHLHVTDSQSWPLEIPSMPDLAQNGAYFPGATYSPEDLQSILEYAEDRGIQVIVEIDMPGHTTSIAETYPDLIAAVNVQPDWPVYAAQPPSGTLQLKNPKVTAFIKKLLDDLLPRLKQHTGYYHSGGDEVNAKAYLKDPTVGSDDKVGVLQPLINKLVTDTHEVVKENGFSPVVWEEMLLEWNVSLAKNTIVQSWIGPESVLEIVEKGYRVIAGSYQSWYLDCGKGQWLDFKPRDWDQFFPFNDYCGPTKSWRTMYSYDPLANLTPEQKALVIGGEAHMWSEQTDGSNLDSTVWPRASAVGEVLWSGRIDPETGKNRTFEDASQRLGEIRERMLARGIQAAPFTQTWCHMNKGDCTFWQESTKDLE